MKAKRILAMLLAGIMLLGTLSACAEKADDTSDEPGADTAGEIETEDPLEGLSDMEKRAYIKDSLPATAFDGAEFRISSRDSYMYEVSTEQEDGEILNDALYKRNQTVENRFGVKIVGIPGGNDNDQPNMLKKTISSADNAFELCGTYVFVTGPIITEGYYLNWSNMEYTDLSQPWWINGVNDCFRIGDAIYAITGDMCVSTLKLTYGMFYNRSKGENYNLNTVYDEIRAGEWTIEHFTDITKDIYEDINGDGKPTNDDLYGFSAESLTNLDIYTFAFDIPITAKDEEGIPQLVINSEKTVNAVDKVLSLYYGGEGSKIYTDGSSSFTLFKNGGALFTTTWLGNAFSQFRDMNDDYSILPYPKYDENQEKYLTGAMDNYTVLGAPITIEDPDFVSLITEAINIESYKTLFPTYYEQALQNKFARDEESIEMIDILMQGRNFDLTTLFAQNISGMSTLFRTVVSSKSNTFTSKYASAEKGALRGLTKVLEAYEANAAK